ncbi:MATE family efflux transporter [Acetivibrio ethanolgignens]|uniref:Probable multidrug resistance protein NorM n=1 Tax=Acetivibrio ethanolgignens TaxID=290052 RepID=A0A0V8QD87_9FIRM|nr:MATE family efflux transporter [Acetivibrio ethanolgignens]KSV58503.1 MATE family efflux transporter [Acetivibrio ethanolgignens]
MVNDLTEGKVTPTLWKFSIPLFLSVVFQQLYNIADSIIAGKFAGKDALAAVGASYPITMIFMAIATGCNIGCSVVVSQLFGEKNYKNVKTAISTSLISTVVVSSCLTLFGFLSCNQLIHLLNTPNNIFLDSALYLRIYILGLIFLFLYNICTGIFTALGDSKTPLYFLIASSLGNIILDLIFVSRFQLGVAGVAWATFLAQGIASLLAFFVLLKRLKDIKTPEKPAYFSSRLLRRIGFIAIPSILQQSFVSVGNLFVQILVNGFGSDVIAGYSAAIKLNTFVITSLTTLGNGLSSFTGQNLGARKIERIRQGFKSSVIMGLSIAFTFTVLYVGFSQHMITLFLNQTGSEAVLSAGTHFLKIVSPFYAVVSIKLVADGVLRGSGAMGPFMISTFSDLILRVILAFILVAPFGSDGIWLSWPLGWMIGTLLSYGFYRFWKWDKV